MTEPQFKVVEYVVNGGRTIDGFAYHAEVSRKSAKEMVYRVGERLGVEGRPDCRKIADKLLNILRNELT